MREGLVRAARALEDAGLNHNHAGNVSVRHARGLLITPSGIPACDLEPAGMVELAADGTPLPGQLAPSSEWRLHAAVYAARPDLEAIVHAHSPAATAVACTRQPIPAFHYMVAAAGGTEIPCAPYATFGSPELADAVARTLGPRGRACLLANHGLLAAGNDLESALSLAREVEFLARAWIQCRQAGEPTILDRREMADVLEAFRHYGQRR